MALIGTFNLSGLTIPNSYVRMEYLSGDKYHGWKAQATVYVSKDRAMPDADGALATGIACPWTYAEPTVGAYEALYEAAKLMPEFAGFTDA